MDADSSDQADLFPRDLCDRSPNEGGVKPKMFLRPSARAC